MDSFEITETSPFMGSLVLMLWIFGDYFWVSKPEWIALFALRVTPGATPDGLLIDPLYFYTISRQMDDYADP